MDAGATDINTFIELETQVWEALRNGDAEADTRLLAEDFLRHRLVRGQSGPRESMYISSLWCRRSGRWVNVFSQDSPVEVPVVR